MSARDRHAGGAPDDWFAEPDQVAQERQSISDPSPAPARSPGARDDWLGHDSELAEPEGRIGDFANSRGARTGIAAGVLTILLLIGLALAGVFSGNAKHPAGGATTKTSAAQTARTAPPTTTGTRVKAPTFPLPTAPLRPGDAGAQVKLLQRALIRLGYLKGTVDGVYGASTTNALTALQRVALLPADGILGPQTLHALHRAIKQAPRASPN